jgi:hypothetical protein
MPSRAPRLLVAAAAAALTAGLVGIGVLVDPPRVPAPVTGGPVSSWSRPAAVLHAWDGRRAAAWAAGDTEALSRLYVAGSSAGAADVALLRRYVARGIVVRGLRMQVLRVRVLVDRPRVIRLEVTDRLGAAVAAGPAMSRALPTDRASTSMLVLRRVAHRWLMASVSPARGR